ncbi:phosphoinositide 3-kinase regulatory subunit 6 isoform X8 [Tursiops truncatus]|uniref:phosphoinositide 3-kinase regulatory subunit 6 isoform X8 n=1 Tax=Tursiops truncatus TaxID=9739 RepID=UPI003CCF9366
MRRPGGGRRPGSLRNCSRSGRRQSKGIKPEVGGQGRTRSRRALQVMLRNLAILLKVWRLQAPVRARLRHQVVPGWRPPWAGLWTAELQLSQEPALCRKTSTLLSILLPETVTPSSHLPQAPMESSDVDPDLQRSVHAVLRELSAPAPALPSNQGMWRWSLHKKVERDPGKSPALVRILLRELEKAESEDARHVIIPLLHTLMYVLTKATGITEELHRRTYAFCTRLLTLPAPYCTIALDCAIRLKTETAVPGTLYQRLVIAEQNLRSELYPYRERVFLFVDPELVSPSVCSALLLEIEAAQGQQTPEACMRHVVSHALQAALGEACEAGVLQRKLQTSSPRALEHYFHAVVAAVEQMASEPSPSREGHLERLEEIYCSLLGPAAAARGRCGEAHSIQAFGARRGGCVPGPRRPVPLSLDTSQPVDPFILDAITYYVRMGTQPIYFQIYAVKIFLSDLSQDPAEDIFLTELKVKIQDSKFPGESLSPRRRGVAEGPGAELSVRYQKALLSHRTREVTVSLRATGLVLKALPAGDTEGEGLGTQSRDREGHARESRGAEERGRRERRRAEPGEGASLPVPGITERGRTPTRAGPGAGRQAARARTRLAFRLVSIEQRWVMLLPPDEPELEGGGTTRRGVRGLVCSCHSEHAQWLQRNFFPLETGTGEGERKDLVSGPTHCPPTAAPETDHTCLNISVTEVVKTSNLAGRSFSTVTNTFRSANVQIQSQDQRLLTLLLDKDSCRAYRDVARFEVAPCPEPCSGAQKSKVLGLSSHQEEIERTKAKAKPLRMPINTFSGIVQ